MAEGARLESVFTRKGNVGSNPTLSASSKALTVLEITLKSVCTRQSHANDLRVGLSHFIGHHIPVDIHRRLDVGMTH